MRKKLVVIPTTLLGLVLVTAGSCDNQSIVDGKAELQVPGGGVCYLLEINIEDGTGGEVGEEYLCVDKAEWDKNRMGREWVDASGKVK